MWPKIFWKEYSGRDDFSGRLVHFAGWSHEGESVGIFDSYISAMASAMGLWEEYCEYHRNLK